MTFFSSTLVLIFYKLCFECSLDQGQWRSTSFSKPLVSLQDPTLAPWLPNTTSANACLPTLAVTTILPTSPWIGSKKEES
ncbi:hypothetical protein ACRRTK_010032 [Alexandromys fortis]